MKSTVTDIEAIFVTYTRNGAVGIRTDETSEDVIFLPLSAVEVSGNDTRGGVVEITLPIKMAEEKGLV